jgi:anti-anti-sigma factor
MSEPCYKHLQTRSEQDVLVLTCADREIRTDEQAKEVTDELLDAVQQTGLLKVVLDLHRLHYISTVAFTPLLQLHNFLKARKGRVMLCCLTPNVAEVLQITRMISMTGSFPALFEQRPTVTAAIAHLNEAQPACCSTSTTPARP